MYRNILWFSNSVRYSNTSKVQIWDKYLLLSVSKLITPLSAAVFSSCTYTQDKRRNGEMLGSEIGEQMP